MVKTYIIKINGSESFVHKHDTFKNLSAVNKGRKWAGNWRGLVKSKCCIFTKEEAEREVARLSTLKNLDSAFDVKEFTYDIVELN